MSKRIALPVLLALAGCQSASTARPKTALEYLAFARAALDTNRPGRARRLLESVDESSFKEADLARYKILLGEAYFALGEFWDAFTTIKEFPRKFPTSEYRVRAEDLEFASGRRLAASGGTFLGIYSDLDDAQKILEHFIITYPRSRHLASALRILGEAAFQARDFELAIERFQELAQRSPSGEWSDLAAYRIAMAHFELLEGPEYDAGAMERARKELASYLSSPTTNEKFLGEARAALAKTLEWMEEKELRIVRYYLTIGKTAGARLRLERLLQKPDPRFRAETEDLKRQLEAMERRARPEKTGSKS